jgi:hypothetical protein
MVLLIMIPLPRPAHPPGIEGESYVSGPPILPKPADGHPAIAPSVDPYAQTVYPLTADPAVPAEARTLPGTAPLPQSTHLVGSA